MPYPACPTPRLAGWGNLPGCREGRCDDAASSKKASAIADASGGRLVALLIGLVLYSHKCLKGVVGLCLRGMFLVGLGGFGV